VDRFRIGPKNLISNATRAGFRVGSIYERIIRQTPFRGSFGVWASSSKLFPWASISILLNDLANKWREQNPCKFPKSSPCSF